VNHDEPKTNRGKIRQVDIAYRRFCDKRGLKYWDCEGQV